MTYGHGQAYDFTNQEFLRRLSTITKNASGHVTDDFREYRRQIFNYFRPPNPTEIDPRLWPWMYGDNMGVPGTTPNAYFSVTPTIYNYLGQWVQGEFVQDWGSADEVNDPQAQADMLTLAALWYCLGGPFHPGCEMTWPMRLAGMYSGPFRIRRRSPNNPVPDYGEVLSPTFFQNQNYPFTHPFWNEPGDITRWMAVPWQTDTASCRAGFEDKYDPYVLAGSCSQHGADSERLRACRRSREVA